MKCLSYKCFRSDSVLPDWTVVYGKLNQKCHKIKVSLAPFVLFGSFWLFLTVFGHILKRLSFDGKVWSEPIRSTFKIGPL